MTTIKVPDMMCENCVRRITQGLAAAGVGAQVALERKTVSVEDGALQKAQEILEDLGFTPEASPGE